MHIYDIICPLFSILCVPNINDREVSVCVCVCIIIYFLSITLLNLNCCHSSLFPKNSEKYSFCETILTITACAGVFLCTWGYGITLLVLCDQFGNWLSVSLSVVLLLCDSWIAIGLFLASFLPSLPLLSKQRILGWYVNCSRTKPFFKRSNIDFYKKKKNKVFISHGNGDPYYLP